MAMRSQVYEWDSSRTTGGTAGTSGTMLGKSVSIFIGGVGNNITMPASTTATQFVVIEEIGATPTYFGVRDNATTTTVRGLVGATSLAYFGPLAYTQVVINTTEYFQDPDNVANYGVPGAASPYPRSVNFQPSFSLHPTVYVLPGQTWDVRYTQFNEAALYTAGSNQCFTKYTLYDGPDSLIANKLLEMGITVNPGNVDWYKRSLLSAASAPAPTNGA
jgi:hypothetical protein